MRNVLKVTLFAAAGTQRRATGTVTYSHDPEIQARSDADLEAVSFHIPTATRFSPRL